MWCQSYHPSVIYKNKMHANKIWHVQELTQNGPDRVVQFSEKMLTLHFLADEFTFVLDGEVDKTDTVDTAGQQRTLENLYWIRVNYNQYPQKVNIWVGIIGHQ